MPLAKNRYDVMGRCPPFVLQGTVEVEPANKGRGATAGVAEGFNSNA